MRRYFAFPHLRELVFLFPPLFQFRAAIWHTLKQELHNLPQPPSRILEVGCGTGWLSRRIAFTFPRSQLLAVDLSPAMVRAARRIPHPSNLSFHTANFLEMDLQERYDLVISAHTWMLLPIQEAFEVLQRILHPRGMALITLTFPGLFTRIHRAFYERVSGERLLLQDPEWWKEQASRWFAVELRPVHAGEPSGLLRLKKTGKTRP